MATGAAGVIIQAINQSWNPFALLICAVLLGVPLANLKALLPDKEATPEPSSQSLQSPRGQQESQP